MVEVEILYTGQLHCQATHKPSAAQITTDAPRELQGLGEAFSPTDLVGTALGSCMVTTLAIAAKRYHIDCKGVRVVVRKEMSTTAPRRIAKLEVDFHLPFPGTHPQRAELEKAALACPVHASLHPDLEQNIHFYWEG